LKNFHSEYRRQVDFVQHDVLMYEGIHKTIGFLNISTIRLGGAEEQRAGHRAKSREETDRCTEAQAAQNGFKSLRPCGEKQRAGSKEQRAEGKEQRAFRLA
jgi:hypothetical protein